MTGPFASLAERFARIPKMALFAAAALIQIALLGAMVADRARILRDGTEVKFRPVRSIRAISCAATMRSSATTFRSCRAVRYSSSPRLENPVVYVKLAPKPDGLYEAVSVHVNAVAVTSPEVLIRGRVAYGTSCAHRRTVLL